MQKKLIKPGPEESIAERKKLRRKRVNEVAKKRKDDKAWIVLKVFPLFESEWYVQGLEWNKNPGRRQSSSKYNKK